MPTFPVLISRAESGIVVPIPTFVPSSKREESPTVYWAVNLVTLLIVPLPPIAAEVPAQLPEESQMCRLILL